MQRMCGDVADLFIFKCNELHSCWKHSVQTNYVDTYQKNLKSYMICVHYVFLSSLSNNSYNSYHIKYNITYAKHFVFHWISREKVKYFLNRGNSIFNTHKKSKRRKQNLLFLTILVYIFWKNSSIRSVIAFSYNIFLLIFQ